MKYFETPLLYFSLIIHFLFSKVLPHLLILHKEIVLCIDLPCCCALDYFFLLYCFLEGSRPVPEYSGFGYTIDL